MSINGRLKAYQICGFLGKEQEALGAVLFVGAAAGVVDQTGLCVCKGKKE